MFNATKSSPGVGRHESGPKRNQPSNGMRVMNDFIWLSNLFTSAATMQNAIPAGAFITANVSIATNEMGGAVVNCGTVSFAAGSVVYAPAPGGYPAGFTSMVISGKPF